MKHLLLPLAAAALLSTGCASTPAPEAGAGTTPDERADTLAAGPDPTASDVRCERYKPIGSNMTERRCYRVGSEEDRERRAREAELRRRSVNPGGPGAGG